MAKGAEMTNPFVFIVGCPRSGTTLFGRMVTSHPKLAISAEIGWIPRRYRDGTGATSDGFVRPELVGRLAEKGSFGRFDPLPMSGEELKEIASTGRMRYADFVSLLFDRYAEKEGKPLAGSKTVEFALSIDVLDELFPEAKFVHLIRDGRNVARSATAWRRAGKLAREFSTWEEAPFSTAALWWEWHVRKAREDGLPLGEDRYHEVFYESLVEDPEGELGKLCGFLGLPYDGAMLRFNEGREQDAPNLDAKHAWKPPTKNLRDWRTQMSAGEVERVEAVAGDLLEELGYERGTDGASNAAAEHARDLRERFEGRPLPARWGVAAAR